MRERMKLLIGYDGSTYADCALEDLRRAGLPRDVEAMVLSVAELWLPTPRACETRKAEAVGQMAAGVRHAPALGATQAWKEAHTLSKKASERLRSHFTAWDVVTETASGSPAREILRKAEAWKPDLIVLGCQGRSALGRFPFGSVSQKVPNEALCSVRVARRTAGREGEPVRIVIGLDGSQGDQTTLGAVASRAWPTGSEARIVTVEDAGRPEDHDHHKLRAWVLEFVAAASKNLAAADLMVSTKIEVGDPKQVLVNDAEEWGADCIFLGSSGLRNGARQCVLGSVATAVVARAHCSVEIVR